MGDVWLGVCIGEDGQEGGRRGEVWVVQDGRTECAPPVHARVSKFTVQSSPECFLLS